MPTGPTTPGDGARGYKHTPQEGPPSMDWKRFDLLRRDVGPIELDLIESYAQSKIKRRDFVKRGTVIGLSGGFMSAVISACGSDDDGDDGATGDDGSGSSTTAGDGGGDGGGGTQGGSMVIATQFGDANSGLDPVNMLDLGTYNVVSQSFEYLLAPTMDPAVPIAPALATAWSPNDDGSVWTFELNTNATWMGSGEAFTSADVAATMDRLAAQGNAGLAGVIGEGSVDATDPAVAVITLEEPNGNFPVLVSGFNAQSLITPADYSDGTTLDGRPEGTGAWKFESHDPTTFTTNYVRNDSWWGGTTPLDSIEIRGFEDLDGTGVTAMQSRDVDMIQQFQVIGGSGLIEDDSFTLLEPPAFTHRQIWFHVENGQFTDPRVRQALAYTLDREQMVNTLFEGRATIGNDHPVPSTLAFFDEAAVEQRTRDIAMAQQLLSDAGVESITATIECGNIQEVPDLAAIMQQNAAEAGFELTVNVQDNSTFYGDAWCPGGTDAQPCADAKEFGIVDYGHRPVPDVYFSSALSSGGVWNSSNYANPDFDTLLSQYRGALDVEGQKTAVSQMMQILHEDTPACYPYFYNYLSGHDSGIVGAEATALGHCIVSGASRA
ncbi:MAG: ABC transporter substrate-binding protein [Acidimicrobiales bacterium]